MKFLKQLLVEAKYYLQDDPMSMYRRLADEEREAGGSVEINTGLPYVSVILSSGEEYFFQDEEADNLLDEVPDELSAEDYILATAQGW